MTRLAVKTYEHDINAWANEQACLLRAGRFELLDVEGIARVIEDVGRSEQRELASSMVASAARADYAEAAAAVLTQESQAGRIYELAGDESYTLGELADEIARKSGKAVAYQDLPESEFKAALLGAGLPDFLATLLTESDVGAAKGGLFDDSRQLSALIDRPTTPLAELVRLALGG